MGARWRAFRAFLRANRSLEAEVVKLVEKFDSAKDGQMQTASRMKQLADMNTVHIKTLAIAIAAGEFKLEAMAKEYADSPVLPPARFCYAPTCPLLTNTCKACTSGRPIVAPWSTPARAKRANGASGCNPSRATTQRN